jgi:hypothetical protein
VGDQWEYLLIKFEVGEGEHVPGDLQKAGEAGWEAVGMHYQRWAVLEDETHDDTMVVLMKRRKARPTMKAGTWGRDLGGSQ